MGGRDGTRWLACATPQPGSIDADEFRLQREGCAGAPVHPAVLAAVASQPLGAIGVAVVEWGSLGGAATRWTTPPT